MAAQSMIGNLAVNLTMETATFRKGVRTAKKDADEFGDRMEALGRRTGSALKTLALGTVGFVAASAGMVEVARRFAKTGMEIERAAQLANTSVEQFQRSAAAAKTVGIESEKLADIYKDVSDRIGEFLQTGGGEMKDFFEKIAPKVGVTAEAFRKLSGADALQLYYTSLEKAGLNQQEMTFYMEAMADEASGLIPLLRDNGREMKNLGDKAAVLNKQDIEGLKRLDRAFDDIGTSVQGLGIALAKSGIADELTNIVNAASGLIRSLEPSIRAFQRWRLELAATKEENLANMDGFLYRQPAAERQKHLDNAAALRTMAENVGKPSSGFGAGLPAGWQKNLPKDPFPTQPASKALRVPSGSPINPQLLRPLSGGLRQQFAQGGQDFAPGLGNLQERLAAISAGMPILIKDARQFGEALTDEYSSAAGFGDVFAPFEKLAKGSTLSDLDEDMSVLIERTARLKGEAKETAAATTESFRDMANDVTSSLQGLASSIQGGGFLDIFSATVDLLLSLGSVGVFGKGIQTNLKSNFGGFRANGGPVIPGKSYIVGENGPEWFTPGSSGGITPMSGGGGGSQITVVPSPYFDVHVDGRAARVAAPMATAGSMAGGRIGEQRVMSRNRRRIPG